MKKIKKLFSLEVISYAFWGIVTSIENIVLYAYLTYSGMDYKIANIITLIIVKFTAYLVNKTFVFRSKSENIKELFQEFTRFFFSRLFTFIIDVLGLIVMIDFLGISSMVSKVFITVIVVVINYFLGKKHVFRKNNRRFP